MPPSSFNPQREVQRLFGDMQALSGSHDSIEKYIEELLLRKLSDTLSHKQKSNKISNLLFKIAHKDQPIQYLGTRKSGQWQLNELTE